MPQLTDLELFAQLSEILTGERKLDRKLAGSYLNRLRDKYPVDIGNLLTTFGPVAGDKHRVFEVKRRILDNDKLRPVAQEVIFAWYTSEFVAKQADGTATPVPGTQDEFYRGLLWKVIGAHPPTHTTMNYGYWTKPPKIK
jgi:hypothetical protein